MLLAIGVAAAPPMAVAASLPAARCAVQPQLTLDTASFGKSVEQFAANAPKRKQLDAGFATAFGAACKAGWLKRAKLLNRNAGSPPVIQITNAPDANVAALYEDDGKRLVLEYPFADLQGGTDIPDAATLKEAIYCYAVGATPKEQEQSGRCLVD